MAKTAYQKLMEQEKMKAAEHVKSMPREKQLQAMVRISEIQNHPLYTCPPNSAKNAHFFGWMRGLALTMDTLMTGSWYNWILACEKGEGNVLDFPKQHTLFENKEHEACKKMLEHCMEIVRKDGHYVGEFIEWIGYSLGIAWFEKPRLSDKAYEELYREFVLDLFYLYPADYLSEFVSANGQSGHLDYFPTPIQVTKLMHIMTSKEDVMQDRTASQFEPCVGGAAMILPSESLNIVGADLSLTMTKVAAIQCFIYKPWALYVPRPVVGIHVDRLTLTINKYYEFKTNTRIYNGDSLLGEYYAPVDIFKEKSQVVDIYVGAIDLTKREIFQYDDYLCQPWENIPEDVQREIVIAQAREIPFDRLLTNPPFNVKLNTVEKEKREKIAKSNEQFLKERKENNKGVHIDAHPVEKKVISEVNERLQLII